MAPDIAIERNGHRTALKWHRARREASDPVFTGKRIREGMRSGASVEVDLVVHGGKGFAVLHDLTLDRETTGTGPVVDALPDMLRGLRLRSNDGAVLDEPVMVLDDLVQSILAEPVAAQARLQLDYKQDSRALDDETIERFRRTITPIAGNVVLSSGDSLSVRLLAQGVPGIHLGYDPCHGAALDALRADGDWEGFVRDALKEGAGAQMIYLDHQVITGGAKIGFDIVAAFHAAGKTVDAYTIQSTGPGDLGLAEALIEMKVDQITTDDPMGLGTMLATVR